MQGKSLGKHMWSVFGPLILRYSIAYVVEIIIIGGYMIHYLKGVSGPIETQEQIYAHLEIVLQAILPYSTQIGAVAALVTIPFLLRMMKKDRIREEVVIIDNKLPMQKYLFAGIMSIAFAIGLNNILLLVNIAEYSEAYQESAELLYMPSIPVQLLCLGIIYPIMEELIFRGLIFRRIRRTTPAAYAVVSSAIFFGIYHGNSVQMIYGTLSGILLGYFCEKFGSMKAPILAHVLMNVTAVILTELDAFTWMFQVPVRMVIITIACAFIASSMLVLIRQKMEGDVAQEVES